MFLNLHFILHKEYKEIFQANLLNQDSNLKKNLEIHNFISY